MSKPWTPKTPWSSGTGAVLAEAINEIARLHGDETTGGPITREAVDAIKRALPSAEVRVVSRPFGLVIEVIPYPDGD